ncbi:hypothetical protein KDN24_12865 [Bacillus sp. Bva_UNVM-123]|uniref:hypothetical protein n=1 Tax=Bacillus sp. Bva_UNVM-123 TaxID=2829798 RepID=UPI00391F572E
MATISSSIQLLGGMNSALNSMNRAMTIVLNSFEVMQRASSNAIDTSSIQAALHELSRAESAFNAIENEINQANNAQSQLNNNLINGQTAADGLANKVKNVIGKYLSIEGLKKGVGFVSDFLGSADALNTVETRLANVMSNIGATRAEYESLHAKASEVGSKSTFGNTALLAGAGELGTYLQSGEAIETMMDTLADYAAGMGGINVDDGQMVDFAGQLGNALNGQYLDLQRNGFQVSEAQKKIIENGTEMEKVAVISDIIGQSWDGMAEAMANTPQGQIAQLKNNFEEIKQNVGNALYPAVLQFLNILNSNMPQVEVLMLNFAHAVSIVIELISGLFNIASHVATFILDNWSLIAPVIFGITAAILAYTAALEIKKMAEVAEAVWLGIRTLATGLLTATTWGGVQATISATAAQWGLNAALMANPIMLVVLGVILLISVIYLVVAAINKFAGTSYSATGIIAGVFSTLGAFIYNIVAFWWNIFASFIEFIVNLFNVDLEYNVKRAFVNVANVGLDMAIALTKGWDGFATSFVNAIISAVNGAIRAWNWFVDLLPDSVTDLLGVGKGTEFTYRTSITSDLENLKTGLNKLIGETPANYWEAPKMNMKSLGDAWDTGYSWGSNLFAKDDRKKEDKFEDILKQTQGAFEPLNETGNKTAANTEKMANSMVATEEDLKYLRDVAERDVINRFTTAEVKVDMTNNNNVNTNLDIDGIIDRFGEKLVETLDSVAEGV